VAGSFLLLATIAVSSRSSPGPSAPSYVIGSLGAPSDFADDFSAAIAHDGDRTWLAVIGQKTAESTELTLRVYQSVGDGPWATMPKPPGHGVDSPLSITAVTSEMNPASAEPCVGYQARTGPKVQCLSTGAWRSAQGDVEPDSLLIDLIPAGNSLVALYSRHRAKGLDFQVRHLAPDHAPSELGPPISFRSALVELVEPATTASPEVGVHGPGRRHAARFILSLRSGAWRRTTPTMTRPEGPLPDGPVRVNDLVYFPVTEATSAPWPLTVPVSRGDQGGWSNPPAISAKQAYAQGGVAVVNGQVWAIWQENRKAARRGIFATTFRVAPLRATGAVAQAPITLWAGETIGPGSVQLVPRPGGDGFYALYMPASPAGDALDATVATVSVEEGPVSN
jgi:hypothetical protein